MSYAAMEDYDCGSKTEDQVRNPVIRRQVALSDTLGTRAQILIARSLLGAGLRELREQRCQHF